MTQYEGVAGTVNQGMETIGEKLEESGNEMAGKAMREPAVRNRVSSFVGDHPLMAVAIALAGLGAYLYFRD